jgi:hypothetical protein
VISRGKVKREEIQVAIKKVVLDVFENMYFMFPEVITEDDPVPSLPEKCFRARVVVKNSSEAFMLYCSEQLVVGMAKNLLGRDHATAEADLVDVFKETANIIAGNLVTTLALDGSADFDVPVAERLQDCSELRTPPGLIFNIDNEFLKATLFLLSHRPLHFF